MIKSSSLRLITVIVIILCIIWIGYRQVVEFQKTHISQESHLPVNQHLILFYANLYQEKSNPSLYILNIDTGKVSKWSAIDNFVPNSIRLISWSEKKQELLLRGSLQGIDAVNQTYSIKSDGTFEKIAPAILPTQWKPDDKRLMLFDNPSRMLGASQSPDGKWWAFNWCPNAHCAIYRTNVNGKNLMKLTVEFAPSLHSVQWSPDNSKIAFVELRGALPSMLWVMNSDGTNATPIIETQGNFAWSPDSSKIAFTSEKDGYEYTFIAAGGKHMDMEFTAYTHSIYMIDLLTKEIQPMTFLRQIETQILWIR